MICFFSVLGPRLTDQIPLTQEDDEVLWSSCTPKTGGMVWISGPKSKIFESKKVLQMVWSNCCPLFSQWFGWLSARALCEWWWVPFGFALLDAAFRKDLTCILRCISLRSHAQPAIGQSCGLMNYNSFTSILNRVRHIYHVFIMSLSCLYHVFIILFSMSMFGPWSKICGECSASKDLGYPVQPATWRDMGPSTSPFAERQNHREFTKKPRIDGESHHILYRARSHLHEFWLGKQFFRFPRPQIMSIYIYIYNIYI